MTAVNEKKKYQYHKERLKYLHGWVSIAVGTSMLAPTPATMTVQKRVLTHYESWKELQILFNKELSY